MGKYYPYWSYREGQKIRSQQFDQYSKLILDLKERKPAAIQYFYKILEPYFNKETAIAVVPSHDPEKKDSGIRDLAKLMCKDGLWIDATDCLERTVKIPKLASGGNRSIQVHLNSIKVVNPDIIQRREVFLLDDVSTTGNTFIACRILLERAGTKSLNAHALGEVQNSIACIS